MEPSGQSWDGSEYDIGFEASYDEDSVWITARKSAYLGLAWVTLAASFRNERFICNLTHRNSVIKKIIIGPIEPMYSLSKAELSLTKLTYEADHPFRREHDPNNRINRREYPRVLLGRQGDSQQDKTDFHALMNELNNRHNLSLQIKQSYNAMAGFGTLSGHILMAEFFLDMSRPSFKHPPHQSYDFEGELGWNRLAPSSHLMSFKHTNWTMHFPEDYDEIGKMDGINRNWNH